jgi:hypothetical protein
MRTLLRLLAAAMLVVAPLGVLAVAAGLAAGNPAQLLVGVSIAIVAVAVALALVYADRSLGEGPGA